MLYFPRILTGVLLLASIAHSITAQVIKSPDDARIFGLEALNKESLLLRPQAKNSIADKNAFLALGKSFFHDVAVGRGEIACASCHGHAGADNVERSIGCDGEERPTNTPSVINAALTPRQGWQGQHASLAAQIRAPVMSPEMTCGEERTWDDLHGELLPKYVLESQEVSTTDSVLGDYALTHEPGLSVTYAELIEMAVKDPLRRRFSTVFVGSIEHYLRSLISTDTPFDRWMRAGTDPKFRRIELIGLNAFIKGQCHTCHFGSELTGASRGGFETILTRTGDNLTVFRGHANTGLSSGQFKTPGLRNVSLTGPYGHNGNIGDTISQSVEFYNSGGGADCTSFASEMNTEIRPLGLSKRERLGLWYFLWSLTSEDVKYRRAPFDGPEVPGVQQAVGAAGQRSALKRFNNLHPRDLGNVETDRECIVR